MLTVSASSTCAVQSLLDSRFKENALLEQLAEVYCWWLHREVWFAEGSTTYQVGRRTGCLLSHRDTINYNRMAKMALKQEEFAIVNYGTLPPLQVRRDPTSRSRPSEFNARKWGVVEKGFIIASTDPPLERDDEIDRDVVSFDLAYANAFPLPTAKEGLLRLVCLLAVGEKGVFDSFVIGTNAYSDWMITDDDDGIQLPVDDDARNSWVQVDIATAYVTLLLAIGLLGLSSVAFLQAFTDVDAVDRAQHLASGALHPKLYLLRILYETEIGPRYS
mmetsp:Transcript_504/g.1749  ORF Transcript_504/g.1749 Transcript_504/m.1749 type:complete len:275 (-) Transcript_504:591-1415(-)